MCPSLCLSSINLSVYLLIDLSLYSYVGLFLFLDFSSGSFCFSFCLYFHFSLFTLSISLLSVCSSFRYPYPHTTQYAIRRLLLELLNMFHRWAVQLITNRLVMLLVERRTGNFVHGFFWGRWLAYNLVLTNFSRALFGRIIY